MKCSVPRCKDEVAKREPLMQPVPPPLALCGTHRLRYARDFRRHFQPMFDKLSNSRKRRSRVTKVQANDVVQAWASSPSTTSWVSTWVQMVDLELLNAGNALGATKGRLDEKGEFIADGSGPLKPSYPHYAPRPSSPLPEHATQAGQEAIKKRTAEQQLLEQRLTAETEEFQKGQRQVLELELKTRREAELRRAAKRLAQKPPDK